MSNQDEQHIHEQTEHSEEQPQSKSAEKKPFVEPEISAAINVFEATTFFLQGSQVGEGV